MINYKCVYCNEISSSKDWNKVTEDFFGTDMESIVDDKNYDITNSYICPKCGYIQETCEVEDTRKTFSGSVSLVANISYEIKANSIEEAKKIIFSSSLPFNLLVDDLGEPISQIDIQGVDWHLVDEAHRGNIQESDLWDFEIDECK